MKNKETQHPSLQHPPAPPRGSQGVPGPGEISNSCSVFWVCPKVSSQSDVSITHPEGHICASARGSNHICWLLSMQRTSSSVPQPPQMSELLIVSQAEPRLTPVETLFSCLYDLILSGTTKKTERLGSRLIGKLRALPHRSALSSPQS